MRSWTVTGRSAISYISFLFISPNFRKYTRQSRVFSYMQKRYLLLRFVRIVYVTSYMRRRAALIRYSSSNSTICSACVSTRRPSEHTNVCKSANRLLLQLTGRLTRSCPVKSKIGTVPSPLLSRCAACGSLCLAWAWDIALHRLVSPSHVGPMKSTFESSGTKMKRESVCVC